jgi:hypothetical protein
MMGKQAIKWAVSQHVDIISMSWAIDHSTNTPQNEIDALQDACLLAAESGILLFCAYPDKGPYDPENNTYPNLLNSRPKDPDCDIFVIGAATQDGIPWAKIHPADETCEYWLPGVELGIQVEKTQTSNPAAVSQCEPPREWYAICLLPPPCTLRIRPEKKRKGIKKRDIE